MALGQMAVWQGIKICDIHMGLLFFSGCNPESVQKGKKKKSLGKILRFYTFKITELSKNCQRMQFFILSVRVNQIISVSTSTFKTSSYLDHNFLGHK